MEVELGRLRKILKKKGRGNAIGGIHREGTRRDQRKGRGKGEDGTGNVPRSGGPDGEGDTDGRVHNHPREEGPENRHLDFPVEDLLRVPTESHTISVTITVDNFALNRVGLQAGAAVNENFGEGARKGGGADNAEGGGGDVGGGKDNRGEGF